MNASDPQIWPPRRNATLTERCGYNVRRAYEPFPGERVCVDTDAGTCYMDSELYDAISDEAFEKFMTAWLAGDYATTQVALGLPDPRDGLAHLAEANERERKAQAATDAHAVPELTVRLPDGTTLPYDECDFSAEQWEQLRAIAPDLVAAIESARPVVARERVEPMGGPHMPVELDPDAMAKLAANDGFDAPLG